MTRILSGPVTVCDSRPFTQFGDYTKWIHRIMLLPGKGIRTHRIPKGSPETAVTETGSARNTPPFPHRLVARQLRMSVRDPETALRTCTVGSHFRARLVWFKPAA